MSGPLPALPAQTRPATDPDFTWELTVPPEAVLERLHGFADMPVVSPAEAKERPPGGRYLVLSEGGFTIHGLTSSADDMGHRIGPAVVGTVQGSDGGSRVELRVLKLAMTPWQRRRLTLAVALILVGSAMLITTGPSLGAATLGLASAAIAGMFVFGGRRRNRETRELLAVAERALGPVKRAAGRRPYR